jgi:hypothetical protein
MKNWHRWLLTCIIATLGGVVQCAADTQPQSFQDYVRHAAIGLAPAIAALKMTLDKGGGGDGEGDGNG